MRCGFGTGPTVLDEIRMGRIVVVGSLNRDIVVRVARFPDRGETIPGYGLFENPGGKGANQACAAARSGSLVTMLGCVGPDPAGRQLIENLSSDGVGTEHLKVDESLPTGTAIITVDEGGENQITVTAGANDGCLPEYLESKRDVFRGADYGLIQMEIPPESVRTAIRLAKEAGSKVILNPAPPTSLPPNEIYPLVDILTPNEREFTFLCGIEPRSEEALKEGSQRLLDLGVGAVIVTLGKKGAFVAKGGDFVTIPGRPVAAVDTTCAGDCFNGVLATCLSEGKELLEAVRAANVAASICVTKKGAMSSIPLRADWEGEFFI